VPHRVILLEDPEHWRSRAAQTRVIADGVTDFRSKQRLLEIAALYDEMAADAERRAGRKSRAPRN
jgi:hypothetical protein